MGSEQTSLMALRLREMYGDLRRHFGYHPQWWPGTPWEIALSAILVQQCDWRAAWKAIIRLNEANVLPLPTLAATPVNEIGRLIAGVSFGPTKSGRLQALAGFLLEQRRPSIEEFLAGGSLVEVRSQLLRLPGIGPETADGILLYAGGQPSFVVDAYTRRIFSRLRALPVEDRDWKASYARVQEFFASQIRGSLGLYDDLDWDASVPREVAVFRDFHAQIVELGRHHCLKANPRCRSPGRKGWPGYKVCLTHCVHTGTCGGCPLAGRCEFGADQLGESPADHERKCPEFPPDRHANRDLTMR